MLDSVVRKALVLAAAMLALGCGSPPDVEVEATDASFVFDQEQLRTYELELEPEALALLEQDPQAEIYVPARLRFEGRVWEQIGLRYKGAYGSLYWCFDEQGKQICPKLSMKLKFTEYQDEGPLFYGLERLNLHAMSSAALPGQDRGGDGSKLHERLGYNLFRDNGVIAPRAVHARVLINGELLGLFVIVEQIDARFAAEYFPEEGEGNVYKEVWPVHLTAEPYFEALKTNQGQASVETTLAFAQALDAAGDEEFVGTLDEWMDVDALMRFIAVDRAIGNWDGVFGLYGLPAGNHNYYWYEQSTRRKQWLIPWDLDHSFERTEWMVEEFGAPRWTDAAGSCEGVPTFYGIPRYPAMCDDFLRRLVTLYDAQWRLAGQEFLDTLYSEAELNARIDAYAEQIDAAVREDPDLDYDEWRAEVEALREDAAGWRMRFQADIDAQN